MEIVGIHHVVGHVPLVYIYVCPLSALRLVARHSVCVLYLQGIEVTVGTQLSQAVALAWQVGIVGHDTIVEFLLLLARQGRSIGCKGVEKHGGADLIVIVIGKTEKGCGEGVTIDAVLATYTLHTAPIAIGDEGGGIAVVGGCRQLVVVFHHHEQVAGTEAFLAPEHLVADAHVVDIAAFVAARYHNSVVDA